MTLKLRRKFPPLDEELAEPSSRTTQSGLDRAEGGALRADLAVREAGLIAALLDDHVQRGLGTALAASEQVVAGVDGDPEQPRLERSAAKLADGAVGRQERLLRGVRCVLGMPKGAERDVIDGGLVAHDELVEGGRVAALCCLQRVRLG